MVVNPIYNSIKSRFDNLWTSSKAASRQALLPFRSIDPFRPLREPDRRRRDEERLFRSEQRTANKPKHHLTGKAPYKFESISLQRGVCKLSVPREAPALTPARRIPAAFRGTGRIANQ